MYDIIIVGGGASGMMAGVHAALSLYGTKRDTKKRQSFRILLLERMDKIGKKIMATGNGKCNFTNLNLQLSGYHGTNASFAATALNRFTVEETILFFKKLGVYPKNKNGWLYPYSEQAASVVAVLQMELTRLGVELCLSQQVHSVQKQNYGFQVKTDHLVFQTKLIILSGGGCASSKLGSNGSNYKIAESLGHSIIPVCPALVQLKCSGNFFKSCSGVRLEAEAALLINEKLVEKETGELLFTDYGVSGILILQLSGFASRALLKKMKVELSLDLFPSIPKNLLQEIIQERLMRDIHKTLEEIFIGLFPHKLTYALLKQMGVNPMLLSGKADAEFALHISNQMKDCRFSVIGTNGFENAQVTSGGVSTEEVVCETLESKLQKGLYFAGELLDIDGICGGYNLQWAWSSGAVAGKAAGGAVYD